MPAPRPSTDDALTVPGQHPLQRVGRERDTLGPPQGLEVSLPGVLEQGLLRKPPDHGTAAGGAAT